MYQWAYRNYALLFAFAGVAVVLFLPSILPGHHHAHWNRRAVIALAVGTLQAMLAWVVQRRERAQRAYHQDVLRNYLQKIVLMAPDAKELVADAERSLDRMEYKGRIAQGPRGAARVESDACGCDCSAAEIVT